MNTKEMRNNMKDWVSQWQTNFGNSMKHLKIFNSQNNTPEGCVSVVTELMTGGSLQNLLESVGNLPEIALRTICQQSLEALEEVHSKLNAPHGMLHPSQILLDKFGKVKVNA
jgi:serine/threonine protein kinase